MRHVCFEVSNRLIQCLGGFRRSRREKLERKRRRIPPYDVVDVHGLSVTFVRAATFGQLTASVSYLKTEAMRCDLKAHRVKAFPSNAPISSNNSEQLPADGRKHTLSAPVTDVINSSSSLPICKTNNGVIHAQ